MKAARACSVTAQAGWHATPGGIETMEWDTMPDGTKSRCRKCALSACVCVPECARACARMRACVSMRTEEVQRLERSRAQLHLKVGVCADEHRHLRGAAQCVSERNEAAANVSACVQRYHRRAGRTIALSRARNTMNITTGAWQLMPPPPPHPSSARASTRDDGEAMSTITIFASASVASATAPPTTCLRYLRNGSASPAGRLERRGRC